MHGEFLLLDKGKMSKSKGDTLTVNTLKEKGYDPMCFRYLCLTTHYRGQLRFSYESLDGARNAYDTLKNKVHDWESEVGVISEADRRIAAEYRGQFNEALANDLNTPVALSALWTCLRDDRLSNGAKHAFFKDADILLGLTRHDADELTLTPEQQKMIEDREAARASKDWKRADELRGALEKQGIILKDRPKGTDWSVKKN